MSTPLVSIIIPTFNRAHCIRGAIDSALAQTYPSTEIIVADDGSTDGTEQVVNGLGHASVRCVRQPNGGCSSARNLGIANARGSYLAFLDSDDRWETSWVARAVGLLEARPDHGAVYASLRRIDQRGNEFGILDLTEGGAYGEATLDYVLGHCAGMLGSNVIARRDIVIAAGGWDVGFPTSGDLDFGLRLAVQARIALVGEPMVRLVETRGSLSKNVNTGNRLRVLDKFESSHPQLAARHAETIRRSRSRILCSYGEDLLWIGQIADAQRQLFRSLRSRFSSRAMLLLMKAQLLRLRSTPDADPAR